MTQEDIYKEFISKAAVTFKVIGSSILDKVYTDKISAYTFAEIESAILLWNEAKKYQPEVK